MKKPTIYDVAKKAGVSIATVSKVVNNKGKISESTREKIKHIMAELDYEPSTIAKALSGKRTKTLGVIVPNIANPFFGEVTRALENHARVAGYTVIICSTYNEIDREEEYVSLLLKQQVDGIIVATERLETQSLKKLNNRNIPIIKIAVQSFASDIAAVRTDNIKGGKMAATYLLEHGHTNVAIIGEKQRDSENKRVEGFIDFYRKNGYLVAKENIKQCLLEYEEIKEQVQLILQNEKRPTAIFATTDFFAIIAINTAIELGFHIPSDLSIIGFDNTLHAKLCQPQLTTIEQEIEEMSKQTIHELIKIIKGKKKPPFEDVVLLPKLIERKSVSFINKEILKKSFIQNN